MRRMFRSKAWGRLASVAALVAGVLALAGCATGYAFVQPGTADSGGYYTSDGPYPGQGYGNGISPYYLGPGDFGYYDFGGFGYDTVYGPSFTFGLGFGSACGWTCAGFYGGWPWYYPGFGYPYALGWYRTGHGHHRRHRGGRDPVAGTTPNRRLTPDHAPVPFAGHRPVEALAQPVEALANRRALDSASFAPHDFVRTPIRLPATSPRAMGMPAEPAYLSSTPEAPMVGRVPGGSPRTPMTSPMAAPRAFSMPPPAVGAAPPPPPPQARARNSKIP